MPLPTPFVQFLLFLVKATPSCSCRDLILSGAAFVRKMTESSAKNCLVFKTFIAIWAGRYCHSTVTIKFISFTQFISLSVIDNML